jgi:TetR/AcrR family transcriptional regulator, lmrAB and yxaGH operons repressor
VAGESRERMIRAAADLFAERGYSATGFSDIIERSGAPRGSIYHHFPGGKRQLAVAALQRYASGVARGIAGDAQTRSSAETVAALLARLQKGLRATRCRAGCPVAGVALDAARDGDSDEGRQLLEAVAASFDSWRDELATVFERDGAPPAAARRLAAFVVAAAEGGLMAARADATADRFADIAAEITEHVRAVAADWR